MKKDRKERERERERERIISVEGLERRMLRNEG
jgi:hypothetical protein